ncbi:amino acid adenylation protein, partial [Mycolicibacterium elephantis]
YWKGSPAAKAGKVRHPWPEQRPSPAPLWAAVYGVTSLLLGGLPLVALGAGLAMIGWAVRDTPSVTAAVGPALLWAPAATLVAVLTYAALTLIGVRVLSVGLCEGYHPVRSRVGWQVWATQRLMDAART